MEETFDLPDIDAFSKRTGYATIPGIVRHIGLDVYGRDFYAYLMDFVGFMGETDRTNWQNLRAIAKSTGYGHVTVKRAQDKLMRADLIYLQWELVGDTKSLNRVKVYRQINPLVWDVNEALGVVLKAKILKRPAELKATSLLSAAVYLSRWVDALKEIAIPELEQGRREQQTRANAYTQQLHLKQYLIWPKSAQN